MKALKISGEPGGFCGVSGEWGEFQIAAGSGPGRPAWGDVVEALQGVIEFPATERMFWAIGEARMEAVVRALEDGAESLDILRCEEVGGKAQNRSEFGGDSG